MTDGVGLDGWLPHFPGAGPLWLTAQLAGITTVILIVLGTPLAWWLARTRGAWRAPVEAVVAMPIVLPPTVMGFYLLILLGPAGPVGRFWVSLTGEALSFSFTGLVIASCVYSLPFVVQPLQNAFQSVGEGTLEAAATLGARPLDVFFSVAVPQSVRGYLTAAVMGFAHTLGEFGVVLMVGGNIPGETRVISIAIYDHVESLNYESAHVLSGILLSFAFVALLSLYLINRPRRHA
ncbi:MAG: molybdate ABC transporter permease subunit [Gammaproteobacteria bacterium]|nr:molybdate ABC transporter permease subunit [Gammaproteobacteria bacterium]NNF61881.1 molybdate ABC transporter permease subunit [Gammaproteobacteria bacterium]NNM19651.1 molybdate ABC transporter permease subunit [Gammaproteobacteria bacterium]